MTRVLDKVRQLIEDHDILSHDQTVVVGVSGGPDSLCLLHALCRLQGEYALSLHVAHLHHGLRGADADTDADFVRSLAEDWRLPYSIERIDAPALAREHRLAVEEAARNARYAFLVRVARQVGGQAIAVGHNADDQTETVLMHWLRGSGLAGLRGMLPVTPVGDYRLAEKAGLPSPSPSPSPAPEREFLPLIRPLLEVTRQEILAYCDYYDLEPRFDRSNLDTTFFRNWLRHEVLPLLAEHNPNVREVIRRSARVVADDYALLRSLLEETWPSIVLEESRHRLVFDLAGWRSLPTSLQRSTIREAIHLLRRSLRNINFVHVENALRVVRDGSTGDQCTLPQGLMLTVGYDRFTVADAHAPQRVPDLPLLPVGMERIAVACPGETLVHGTDWVLETEVLAQRHLAEEWSQNVDRWRAYLDLRATGTDLWLRPRRPGDRFPPLGMEGHTVKLADFFTNQKVPWILRDRWPLLVGETGILWVCGQRPSHNARVVPATEQVLALRFARQPG
ncbi:MAG: tRNA lysidine(34) synthetase TilS [Anaerolineae bacterium]|jgi:tRNA(Ile)-lysidine synthase